MPNYRNHQRSASSGSRNGPVPYTMNQSNLGYPEKIRIPHTFMVHTYGIPTVCQYCKKLLKGLFKQGLQCKDCQYNTHKKCMDKVPQDCNGERQPIHGNDFADMQLPAYGTLGSSPKENSENFFREEFDDSDNEDNPTIDYGSPVSAVKQTTTRQYGTKSAHSNNHAPKAKTNAHNCPPELVNGLLPQDEQLATNSEAQSMGSQSEQSSSSSSPSANIPLMRIVQSVKHTKKRGGQAIKEGWLVHFTSLDKAVKRYFWRLDSKTITLFVSEQGSKYHKEIQISDIQAIDVNKEPRVDNNYCFEIRTSSLSYYVGQDPLVGAREEQPIRLPPPDSGIGSDIAKSWETAIKQAYMHVTNTR